MAPNEMRRIPQQDRSRELVAAVLTAAEEMLVAGGLEGLNTKRVAERAGVSVGSVYQYFPNEKALVAEIIARRAKADEEALAALLTTASSMSRDEVWTALAHGVVQIVATHRALYRAMLPLVGRVERADAERRLVNQAIDRIAAWLGRDDDIQEPDRVAFVVVNAVHAVAGTAAIERPELLEQGLADDLAKLAIDCCERARRAGGPASAAAQEARDSKNSRR